MKFAASLFLTLSFTALAHADAVTVQVVGPDKKPLAGAQVRVVEGVAMSLSHTPYPTLDFTTDAAGNLTFESKNSLTPTPGATPYEMFYAQNKLVARVSAPGMAFKIRGLKAGANTIELEPGKSWGGQVLDPNGKPAAGVGIVEIAVGHDGEFGNVPFPSELRPRTVTGADGKWSLDNLPTQGRLSIYLDQPQYVREEDVFALNQPTAPPIFTEPSATIKGRILTPDGQPAAGVSVYPGAPETVSFFRDSDVLTGPDGRFELTGLPAGDFVVQHVERPQEKPLPFILDIVSVTTLKAGETRDMGDWKSSQGIEIRGVVTAEKKPVLGTSVNTTNYAQQTFTDKNGAFSLRTNDVQGALRVNATGYISLLQPLGAAVNGVIDLGQIELKTGLSVSGTVKAKDGGNPGVVQLVAQDQRGGNHYTQSTEVGAFTIAGLSPGTYTLTVQGFTQAQPLKFQVVAGQKAAPLAVVIEGPVAAIQADRLVHGRAIDLAGAPVAGAHITLSFSSPDSYYNTSNVISNLDGSFEANFGKAEGSPQLVAAKRPGLVYASSSDFKPTADGWETTLTFQPRGAALKGHVLDSDGKPVAGAAVSTSDPTAPVATTGADGAFSLPDVPLQNITVLAGTGAGFGQAKVEGTTADVRVTLVTTPGDPQNAAQMTSLADELLQSGRLGYLTPEQWNAAWDILGTARMEAVVKRAGDGRDGKYAWQSFLTSLAARDPEAFLARGEELVGQLPEGDNPVKMLLLRLQARSDDPAQRAKAQAWLDANSHPSLAMTSSSVSSLLQIGVVAEALKPGAGAKWVEFASQIAAQLPGKGRQGENLLWGASASLIGGDALANLTQDWGAYARFGAYQGAFDTAVNRDMAAATKYFKLMEATVDEAQKDQGPVEEYTQKPKDTLGWERSTYATALSKADPVAALALLPDTPDYSRADLLVAIAKSAAQKGDLELATRALRQTGDVRYVSSDALAGAAKAALSFDAKLADELFAAALARNLSSIRVDSDGSRSQTSLAGYAAAIAKKSPGTARILIEREWAKRLPAYQPPKENQYDDKIEWLRQLAIAMAKASPRRTLEMVEALPGTPDTKTVARGQVALTLLEIAGGKG